MDIISVDASIAILGKVPRCSTPLASVVCVHMRAYTTLDLWQRSSTVVRQMLLVITVESLMHGM